MTTFIEVLNRNLKNHVDLLTSLKFVEYLSSLILS